MTDHAAFAGHDVLGLLKAEYAGMSKRACFLLTPGRSNGLGSILNNNKIIARCDCEYLIHVGHISGEMQQR